MVEPDKQSILALVYSSNISPSLRWTIRLHHRSLRSFIDLGTIIQLVQYTVSRLRIANSNLRVARALHHDECQITHQIGIYVQCVVHTNLNRAESLFDASFSAICSCGIVAYGLE